MVKWIRALGAFLALVGLLVGVPVVLLSLAGVPYPPGGLAEVAMMTDTAILDLLAVLGWIFWAQMTVCVVWEIPAALRGAEAARMPIALGGQQWLARVLVHSVLALGVGGASVGTGVVGTAHTAAAAPDPAGGTTTASQTVDTTPHSPVTTGPGAVPSHEPAGGDETAHGAGEGHPTVRVTGGDTLWGLAERHLGEGERWREIVDLNRGRDLGDGTTATSARLRESLQPGWELRLPMDARDVDPTDTHTRAHDDAVVVDSGDSLSEIAETELGDADRWQQLYEHNREAIGPDPDLIHPGDVITLPGTPEADEPPTQPTRQDDRSQADGGQDAREPAPPSGRTPPASYEEPAPTSTPEAQPPQPPHVASVPPQPLPRDEGDGQPTATSPMDLDDDEDDTQVPWLLAGLTGAGVVLCGGLYLGLRTRRRSQFRARRPGRTIAEPDPSLAPVEKTIISTGARAAATVEFMDTALRRLATWSAAERVPMPSLAAVELTDDALVLHLVNPADLPAPWTDSAGDRLHWRYPTTREDIDQAAEDEEYLEAPYPMLVPIGNTPAGSVWLLNCEELAGLTITGDLARGRDFVRHLAASLAMNPWSAQVRVECVGLGADVTPMNTDRIHYRDTQQAAAATAEVLADAVAAADRSTAADSDVVTGRTGQVDDDVWPAHLLVLDAAAEQHDTAPLEQLLQLVHTQPGRTATSVLLVGEEHTSASQNTTTLHLSADGQLTLAAAGLELNAVGLTVEEAQGCAAVLSQREDLADVEIPVDETAEDGWQAYANQAGALRREQTLPRSTPPDQVHEPVTSILQAPDEDYIREAAATEEDLHTVAPRVTHRVRTEVEDADPTLDQDLADWLDEDCWRPRLSLLGPVGARTRGKPLAKRKAYFTELLAYLALRRRHGVTPAETADAFSVEVAKMRTYIHTVREWLGTNLKTGEEYLPHADKAPAAHARGVPVYQVDEDLLIDIDLFRRVRVRGEARGPEGIEDLRTALMLVTGRPFDQLRHGGWAWLIDGDRLDHHMTVAIADVAFLVTTHSLEQGDTTRARAAAEIAARAAPDEEATRLCLARVAEAEGSRTEAERILREAVCDRSDDGGAPTDLPERTQAIIRNHGWLQSGDAAAS